MRFSNVCLSGLVAIAATQSLCVVVEARLGANARRVETSEHNVPTTYSDYTALLKSSTTSEAPLQENNDGDLPAKIPVQFPDGVFDISQAQNTTYMRELPIRCNDLYDSSNPGQVLACGIYFDQSYQNVPMALGTLRPTVNLYDATQDGLYRASDIDDFFVDYALAAMIQNDCFVLDTSDSTVSENSYSYTTEQDYKSVTNKQSGVYVSVSENYGPISMTAGYNEQVSSHDSTNHTSKVAYGETKWIAQVGTLRNSCLSDKDDFVDVVLKNKLINEDAISLWKFIQESTVNASDLAETSQFQSIAMGGLILPNSYEFGAAVSYTIDSTFTETDSSTSSKMSTAINAGLSLKFEDGGGSASAQVTNAVQTSAQSSDVETTVDVSMKSFGSGVSPSCVGRAPPYDCNTMVSNQTQAIKNDVNIIGNPYTHSTFVALDDIVTWYTGQGLGETFNDALTHYFTYQQCAYPGSGVTAFQPYPQATNLPNGPYHWAIQNQDEAYVVNQGELVGFVPVPALSGDAGAISFESVTQPGYYLRHESYLLWLDDASSGGPFPQDASFYPRPNKFFQGYTAFESVNYPGYFIRHESFRLQISECGDDQCHMDGSFQELSVKQYSQFNTFDGAGNAVTTSDGNCDSGSYCVSALAFPNQGQSVCAAISSN